MQAKCVPHKQYSNALPNRLTAFFLVLDFMSRILTLLSGTSQHLCRLQQVAGSIGKRIGPLSIWRPRQHCSNPSVEYDFHNGIIGNWRSTGWLDLSKNP